MNRELIILEISVNGMTTYQTRYYCKATGEPKKVFVERFINSCTKDMMDRYPELVNNKEEYVIKQVQV